MAHPSASTRSNNNDKGKAKTTVNGHANNVNLPTAYLLYFLGGIFGLHHAYLNRPHVAMAWYATSGLFGLGLLRDFFKIPYYVSLCRDDRAKDATARVRAAMVEAREGKPPMMSFGRIILMAFFGAYFGFVGSCLVALPSKKKEDGGDYGDNEQLWWTEVVYGLLRAIGAAVGIWLVGNMGEEMIVTKTKAKAAAQQTQKDTEGGDKFDEDDDVNQKGEFVNLATWCIASLWALKSPVLGGILCAIRRRRYRSTMRPVHPSSSSAMKRIVWHLLKCAVFTTIMTLAAVNHGSIIVNGNRVYLQDALKNALHSNFWKEFDWEKFREQQQSSSGGGSDYLKNAFDISGERAARRTLGVARDATHSEIRSAYKKLALKYHPDKIGSDATEKEIEEANRQFNKVQEAYDVLNSIEQARKKRNREAEDTTTNARGEAGGGSNYYHYHRDEM